MDIELFSELPKVKDSLYVFDIDDTTLYYDFRLDKSLNKAIEYFEENLSKHRWLFRRVNALWEKKITQSTPTAHDRHGMEELRKFCSENNSRIIFLTARFKSIEQLTISHLQELYPWIPASDIYSCDGIEKGIVLSKLIDKLKYNTIVFADDKEYNIRSVKKYIPSAQLYKMIINFDSLS